MQERIKKHRRNEVRHKKDNKERKKEREKGKEKQFAHGVICVLVLKALYKRNSFPGINWIIIENPFRLCHWYICAEETKKRVAMHVLK